MDNKEYMYNLSERMLSLQEQIANGKKENHKIKLKTFGKRTWQVLKAGIALTTVPLVGAGCSLAFGWNPFRINELEKDTCIVTYIDEEGNKFENQTEEAYTSSLENTITYYEAWSKLEDNETYCRKVYKYKVNESSLLSLVGIIQTNQEMTLDLIEDLFIENLTTDIEISKNVSLEELNKGAYVTGTYYSVNKNKTILVRESVDDHTSIVVICAIIGVFLMIIEGIILKYGTYFFENIKDGFTEKMPLVDIENLKKQLEQVMEELQESINKEPKKYIKK